MDETRVIRHLQALGARPRVFDMPSEAITAPVHEHDDAWPHDDTHHVVAAFALLLVERGAETFDAVSARLSELQVARGTVDRESLGRVIGNLERAGLLASREASASTERAFELTASGRAFVNDWALIMRDRRRLSRSFLALYDRVNE